MCATTLQILRNGAISWNGIQPSIVWLPSLYVSAPCLFICRATLTFPPGERSRFQAGLLTLLPTSLAVVVEASLPLPSLHCHCFFEAHATWDFRTQHFLEDLPQQETVGWGSDGTPSGWGLEVVTNGVMNHGDTHESFGEWHHSDREMASEDSAPTRCPCGTDPVYSVRPAGALHQAAH